MNIKNKNLQYLPKNLITRDGLYKFVSYFYTGDCLSGISNILPPGISIQSLVIYTTQCNWAQFMMGKRLGGAYFLPGVQRGLGIKYLMYISGYSGAKNKLAPSVTGEYTIEKWLVLGMQLLKDSLYTAISSPSNSHILG